jgi:hypothetical protein
MDARGDRRNNGRLVARWSTGGKNQMFLLLIVLLVLALAAAPAWPYSRGWGYYPSGGLGIVLLVVVLLMLTGHI